MARKPRIEFPGAFYHVITRGNRKAAIFKDDRDRERFLQKLREYKERYGFIIYAYTLMYNHIHLLIETGKVPLSKIMQGFLQSYTQWYNGKYITVGHLFQGRYKSILCDKRIYLLNLIRYIHLNMVRAGLVKDPAEYKWSSHRIYLGIEESDFVDCDFVLAQFAKTRKRAIKLYKEFVMEWIGEGKKEEFYRTVDQRFLGREGFVEEVKKKIGEELRREENILKNKTFEEIAEGVKQVTGVNLDLLHSRRRKSVIVEARSLFVRLALMYSNYKRKEIAEYLGKVPRIIPYLERKLDDKRFELMVKKLQW